MESLKCCKYFEKLIKLGNGMRRLSGLMEQYTLYTPQNTFGNFYWKLGYTKVEE